MIQIIDKHKCCGCEACVQICSKHCISFEEDEHGFRYPKVNRVTCVDCGLCENVCPALKQSPARKPIKVYAYINQEERIRLKSSSGGFFSSLAKKIINQGGVVFGARFNEKWEVVHGYTETYEGLEDFRGSKYVQSRIGNSYSKVKDFLRLGRMVLFTGTPCQISALNSYLRKPYDNLYTCEVVCHGVPSPLVWRRYLTEEILRPKGVDGKNSVLISLNEVPVITGVSFRDKQNGWKKYGFVVRGNVACGDKNTVLPSVYTLISESQESNPYLRTFFSDLCLRPSCYQCPAKSLRSNSDFTIADFWGIENTQPEFDDDKGTSLVLVNTVKATSIIQSVDGKFSESSYDVCLKRNHAIEDSAKESDKSELFWTYFNKNGFTNITNYIVKLTTPTKIDMIKRKFRTLIRIVMNVNSKY